MPQPPAINEIRAKKESLEARLLEGLREFEATTGLSIHDVRIVRLEDWCDGSYGLDWISLDVRLTP